MEKGRINRKSSLADNRIKIILLTVLSVFVLQNVYSQVLYSYLKSEKPDYCLKDSLNSKSIIGKQVKIWDAGGIYPTINQTNTLKFPTREMKQKSGKSGWGNYYPKEGDIGTVVHIFRSKDKLRNIYLIKVGDNYVPIACHYLTNIDLLDISEEWKQHTIQDSIGNVQYANGCKFKIKNANENWSRAGLMNIDKVSETFACNLISKGIDTVLLCKHIFDNGSLPIEKAFILWTDKGKGYLKSFFNNPQHSPTENEIVLFESESLINYFFENRIDTVKTKPKSDIMISHSMGYSVQLYTPNYFYRERLTDFLIGQDKEHIKSVWWNLISEKLGNIKQE
jgi:hypothetical protein